MSKINQSIGEKYKVVGGRLGVGNFGEVRLGMNTVTNERYVSKNKNDRVFLFKKTFLNGDTSCHFTM